ncbi:MAG: hypothetical protein Q9207_005859 [Kuettlingeria erythrocarpa]
MPIQLPSWSQTKTTSKQGFDKVYNLVDKLGPPINKLSNKIGSEAFWPTTLDIESNKAARILRSFCKDGFYVEEPDGHVPAEGQPKGKGKVRVVKKIPSEVIRRAKGLAIFTTMRTGLWVSGAGGSGILVGRTPNGDWSPPSGIMLHTAGLGFLVGVDIYDCVVVINTEEALEAFTRIRCTLGGELSVVAGPVGAGGILETEVHKRQAPVWTYLKSRGFYAGVQVDGTVIIERTDENERFYGERIKVADILAGKVRHSPYEIRTLMATIKAAQGDKVDETVLPPGEPTPGDMELEKPEEATSFGLPTEDDPDPFGVRALEAQGMEIREAGTKSRPSLDAFQYKPAPSSPIYNTFRRHSLDSTSRRNSKRDSSRSIASIDRGTQTHTTAPSIAVDSPLSHSPLEETSEKQEEEAHTNGLGISNEAQPQSQPSPIMEQAAPQPVITRARLVNIPKRIPPALPPRSPYRQSPRVINAKPPPPPVPSIPTGIECPDSPTDTAASAPSSAEFADISLDDGIEDRLPAQQALAQDLTNVHPRSSPTHPRPLKSPGLDSASVSGSDYSRAQSTPAQTPGLDAETESTVQTPITMEDQEATPVKASSEHHDLRLGSTEMQREGSQASDKKDDEFHSIPSTPIESIKRI